MTDIKKAVEKVSPGLYDMRSDEMRWFFSVTRSNIFDGLYTAFKYGFLKGQRSERKRLKA